jgi:hypothetical protein
LSTKYITDSYLFTPTDLKIGTVQKNRLVVASLRKYRVKKGDRKEQQINNTRSRALHEDEPYLEVAAAFIYPEETAIDTQWIDRAIKIGSCRGNNGEDECPCS